MIYDLAIIGGGPAGVAAGVYAARKRLKTVFITYDFNSQSVVSEDIQNWIGTTSIRGEDLAKNFREHLLAYSDQVLDLKEGEYATKIEKKQGDQGEKSTDSASKNTIFTITTDKSSYEARTVLITSGSQRRKLLVPGAAEYENKGLTYCASCDGPLFTGKDVVVVGGGNAGFETAAQLLAYSKSVTLLHHGQQFKADPVTVEKVLSHPNMKAIKNAETVKVLGEKFVTGIVYKTQGRVDGGDMDGQEITLPVQGVFVEIGLIPATSFAKDLVKMNPYNQIQTDPRTQMTSVPGIWAAGDCTDGLYHQNNIAAGDAVKALEDIYLFLNT